MTQDSSDWQKKIEGEWYGRPGLFDAEGNFAGWERVTRASEFVDGETRYWMNTELDARGPLRNRLELGAQFDFGVTDSDENRIYLGPDFYGTGQPYGTFVDANYYSPGWQADLRTWNQIIDGDTQVYSSVLSDGWAVVACFNGVYKVAHDYETNPATRERIDAWVEAESQRAASPQVLPTKQAGTWVGTFDVHTADRGKLGETEVRIEHEPLGLRRARHTVTWSGELDRSYTFERYRDGARVQYDGPDVFGGAIGYGRALFTSQHRVGDIWKIKGREYLLDRDSMRLAVVWQLFDGDTITHLLHGALTWTPA